jgi:hypothetical protein
LIAAPVGIGLHFTTVQPVAIRSQLYCNHPPRGTTQLCN